MLVAASLVIAIGIMIGARTLHRVWNLENPPSTATMRLLVGYFDALQSVEARFDPRNSLYLNQYRRTLSTLEVMVYGLEVVTRDQNHHNSMVVADGKELA